MMDVKLTKLPQGRLLAGVSGGADSVALLCLLKDSGANVCAVHVNHGLRGESADEDERFVCSLCTELQVPLKTYRLDPPADPGENWLREARYACFRMAMQHFRAETLVLAHHQDDQAETVLLHLLRGAGLHGMCGMQPDIVVDGMRIIRPLLGASRQALRQLLQSRNQPWREDASNGDVRYLRNALRLQLLPMLERLSPGASARLADAAALLRLDNQALDQLAQRNLAAWTDPLSLPLTMLSGQPEGLLRRLLRLWWQRAAGGTMAERSLSLKQTEALTALVNAPAAAMCNLPGGWHARRGWTHLHLTPPASDAEIPETKAAECPLFQLLPDDGRTGDGVHMQRLPETLMAQCTVRSRREGDWIRPFGSPGRQKLQDYFVNRKVDEPFRNRVPLLCRGSEVLLAGGVGAGDIPIDTNDQTLVLLVWNEAFPWQ